MLLHPNDDQRRKLNELLLPPAGSTRVHRERIDERGIRMPDWWSDDENDSTEEANVLLAMRMRSPRR